MAPRTGAAPRTRSEAFPARRAWFVLVRPLARLLFGRVRDVAPIILVVAFFQLVVLRQPFPNLESVLIGLLFVIGGLALFLRGLEMGLFPLGEGLARDFAQKGNIWLLLAFGFLLGFGATVAEPALIAVTTEVGRAASKTGMIADDLKARGSFAWGLRALVGLSVGTAIVIGILRVAKGWPLHWIVIGGYLLVVVLSQAAPREILGVAYDLGGVTTSTITVPLVTALGVGLSRAIRGRNPLVDGFGIIGLATVIPMIFVLAYGLWR